MLISLGVLLCLAVGLTLVAWRAPLWSYALLALIIAIAAQIQFLEERATLPSFSLSTLLSLLPVFAIAALAVRPVRRGFVVAPVYGRFRKAARRLSDVVRDTLEAGTVGFEAELFGGKPNWQSWSAKAGVALSADETAFLNGATEDLCRIVDDWQIRHQQKEIPAEVWDFMKSHGFFGVRIARTYGGLGFSAQALSLILGKIASRSPDIFGVLMIPNTLGLGELIEVHGTSEQKRTLLPRLTRGDDIPCLALTGPESGSDTAAMRDVGTVMRGTFGGAEVIGIRASWDKRYITLAPNATLIAVAFHVFDPENLLGRGEDVGITVAIVPANYEGVQIGRRHLPSGSAVPIGPTRGIDVFIPLDWVIGGETMVGRGWRMLVECVAASRAVALPSCAAAGNKALLRVSTAYSRVRRQFGSPIGAMEELKSGSRE